MDAAIADTGVRIDASAPADASAVDATPVPDATEPDAAEPDAAEPDATPADSGTSTTTAVCGNNQVERGEECDDGNVSDDQNGCSSDCHRNSVCGNAHVEALFETCDVGASGCCNSTCDGVRGAGEVCRAAASDCDVSETCDGVTTLCPVDAIAGEAASCTSCPRGSNCAGCFGGVCLDRRAFCADILAQGDSVGDGVYTIRPAGTATVGTNTSTMSVYCDMTTEGGGWTLVYKKSRLVPGDGGQLWTGTATNTDLLPILNRAISSVDYNSALQTAYWPAFSEARVEVLTGTVVRHFIDFNTVATTPTSWFAADRHTSSSWTDLPTSPTFDNGSNQAFRIGGGRSFYINRVWNGCPSDRGWLMISTIDVCYWETATGDPTDILYARGTTEAHIPDVAQTGTADTLVIFVR